MLTAILKESYKRRIPIHVKPAVIMKRGVCSFVSKAMRVASDGAGLALMVNQDDTLPDTNAGKENTTMCTAPFATVKESDGKLVQLTAATGEVLVIAHESLEEDFRQSASQSSCIRLHTLAEDIIDQWPHSVPHIPIDTVSYGNILVVCEVLADGTVLY